MLACRQQHRSLSVGFTTRYCLKSSSELGAGKACRVPRTCAQSAWLLGIGRFCPGLSLLLCHVAVSQLAAALRLELLSGWLAQLQAAHDLHTCACRFAAHTRVSQSSQEVKSSKAIGLLCRRLQPAI